MKKIKYLILEEHNYGTEDEPKVERTLKYKYAPWSLANEEAVKSDAYNGEYEIFDDGEPEPEPTEQEQLRADVDFLLAMGGML